MDCKRDKICCVACWSFFVVSFNTRKINSAVPLAAGWIVQGGGGRDKMDRTASWAPLRA